MSCWYGAENSSHYCLHQVLINVPPSDRQLNEREIGGVHYEWQRESPPLICNPPVARVDTKYLLLIVMTLHLLKIDFFSFMKSRKTRSGFFSVVILVMNSNTIYNYLKRNYHETHLCYVIRHSPIYLLGYLPYTNLLRNEIITFLK